MRRRKGISTLDIRDHALIPKHSKVSEKEKKELLEKYNISLKELPKIFKSDPAVRSLNVEVGDVVKITRKSATAGQSIYFRGVIND